MLTTACANTGSAQKTGAESTKAAKGELTKNQTSEQGLFGHMRKRIWFKEAQQLGVSPGNLSYQKLLGEQVGDNERVSSDINELISAGKRRLRSNGKDQDCDQTQDQILKIVRRHRTAQAITPRIQAQATSTSDGSGSGMFQI